MTDRSVVIGDDGLPVMPVGGVRAARKHYFLEYYAAMMSKLRQYPRRAYVDLFAGPGRVRLDETGAFDDGSPLKALRHEFTEFVFVELDDAYAAALEARLAAKGETRRYCVLRGDCNERIDDVVRLIPPRGLTLAFIDPTNWQIRFDTVRKLAAVPRVDLIVSMFLGSMKRVPPESRPDIDAFFGTDRWRQQPYTRPDGGLSLDGMMRCYREQLATLGYINDPGAREIVVYAKEGGPPLYLLAFFSGNKLGYKLWNAATRRDETGQMTLSLD
jgi:three-Cys-motif partner protein